MKSLWERKRRILKTDRLPPGYRLIQSPTAWRIGSGLIRVFFAARDANNRSQLLAVDVDPFNKMRIVSEHFTPLINIDGFNSCYKDGIGPSCFVKIDNEVRLFASAVSLARQPYSMSIVTCVTKDDGATFSKPVEILSSADNNNYPVGMPMVLYDGNKWHMWYTAFTEWLLEVKPHPDARYIIRHAVSPNGSKWKTDEQIAIDLKDSSEAGLARPTVYEKNGMLEMWFSLRGPISEHCPSSRFYRLIYATKDLKKAWQRRDKQHSFINPPEIGDWDFEMQCYPNVFQCDADTLLFYSGNAYGAGGIGYARRIQ